MANQKDIKPTSKLIQEVVMGNAVKAFVPQSLPVRPQHPADLTEAFVPQVLPVNLNPPTAAQNPPSAGVAMPDQSVTPPSNSTPSDTPTSVAPASTPSKAQLNATNESASSR